MLTACSPRDSKYCNILLIPYASNGEPLFGQVDIIELSRLTIAYSLECDREYAIYDEFNDSYYSYSVTLKPGNYKFHVKDDQKTDYYQDIEIKSGISYSITLSDD